MKEMGLAPEGPTREQPRDPACTRPTAWNTRTMLGEIGMLLDDAEVNLRAGEGVVQQGTNHAWVNRANSHVAFIPIAAKTACWRAAQFSIREQS
jgi:hypothetical protein